MKESVISKKTHPILHHCLLSTAMIVAMISATAVGMDKSKIVTVTADSQAPGFDLWRAMDGDPRTIWHTILIDGGTRHPHDIGVDMGRAFEVTGFSYLPRTDEGRDGTISDYEFYVGSSDVDFAKPVVSGAFVRADGQNIVRFDKPVTGRYVKLRALSDVNNTNHTSIAELQIFSEGVKFLASNANGLRFDSPADELEIQYGMLLQDLRNRKHIASHTAQTFNQSAMILETDRDPLDIVLRRTEMLLGDLKRMVFTPGFPAMEKQLAKLRTAGDNTPLQQIEERIELFKKVCLLRRKIAFCNPLLDFDKILFITRHRSGFNHMCDQYYGINTKAGGGLYVLSKPFGDNPEVRDVLKDSVVERGRLKGQKLTSGSFLSPDLSYDGSSILFAYVECEGDKSHNYHTDPTRGHWDRQRCYHIFKVNVDGSGLEQLTDGTWNDFDPCWMPNGRVAFITERRGGYLRCGRVCPTYTLYDMLPDGEDIRCLSPHETNEWHPSISHDGMIVYTRWDYVDRHGCTAHLPWVTTPDGRNARAMHGNFAPRELRADMELDVQAIPGSHKFVATAAPHHGQAFGSLVIFDPHIEDDDAMAPVRRITPEVDFPESQDGAQVYGTAWPLSENYYLCVYDPTMQPEAGHQGKSYIPGNYGIYLVDAFGNKELIYRDIETACQSPMPLRSRKQPPVVPDASLRIAENQPAEGTLAVVNVYESLKPWPEGTKIKALRIYQVLPMSVPSGAPPHEIGLRLPTGSDSVMLARYVLGTVPVEEDGSAHFTVPARKELFFQAIDENGLAIQSMRSATYVQPGEKLLCQGCHEPRHRAPQSSGHVPIAMRRSPSKPAPDVDGTNPFSYPRLVQPVLDKHCVGCHKKHPEKAPRLDSEVVVERRKKWYASYFSLAPEYGFWKYGDRHRTTPGKFGARASKLYAMLEKGHHGLKLSAEDMHRIAVWLDSCSVFYGVYEKEGGEAQLLGKVAMPTLE